MPETRIILIADARGIPCLQLLQNKKKRNEVSELLTENVHPSSEIARKKQPADPRRTKSIMAQATAKIKDLTDWMSRFNSVATRYLQQH